jgi:hypothetical protein
MGKMKYLNLTKYIPFFIGSFILFVFSYKTVAIEKIYDKYYILVYYKYHPYTIHDITIDTNFGKIYLKRFTPTEKIYSFASEISDPPYYSEYIGLKIGHNSWTIYNSIDNCLKQNFIILGNEIKNMNTITFYQNGSFEINLFEQELIIKDKKYDEIRFINYSPDKNILKIGSLPGVFDFKFYIIENG